MRPSKLYIKKVKISNLDEVLESMEEENWFYAHGLDNYDWYYRIEQMPITNSIGERGYLVRRVNMTSAKTQHCSYYWFEKDENGEKVFIGAELEKFIEKQAKMWIKQLNLNTMTAFAGKRYASFLNAIPKEVLQENKFYEKLLTTIVKAVENRKQKEQDAEEREKLDICEKATAVILMERAKGKSKHVNGNSSATAAFQEFARSK